MPNDNTKLLVDSSVASDLEVARALAAKVAEDTKSEPVVKLAKALTLVEREQSLKEHTREWLKENSLYGDGEVGSTLTGLVAKIYKEHGDDVSGDIVRRRFNALMDEFHGTRTITLKSYEYDKYFAPVMEQYAKDRESIRKGNAFVGALVERLEHVEKAQLPEGAESITKAVTEALPALRAMIETPAEEPAEKTRRATIVKAETEESEERYVLGVVLEPEVVDFHKDIYSAEEIRKAAHDFMEKYQRTGLQHTYDVSEDVKILESYITPADMTIGKTEIKKGTWMLAVRVNDDEIWEKIKDGKLTGFSMGGSAVRVDVEE